MTSPNYEAKQRKRKPTERLVGCQFNINTVVWEKFKRLAKMEALSVPELIVEIVEGHCAQNYSEQDEARGCTYPKLVGSGGENLPVT